MSNEIFFRIEILESPWNKFLDLNSNIILYKDKCRKVKNQIIEYFEGARKTLLEHKK